MSFQARVVVESLACAQCPLQQHSPQNLPLQPMNFKSKILVASFLIKLFLSIIFPLTIGVEDEVSLLFMNILGHSYSDWPDANSFWAPGLLKYHFPVPGMVLGKKKITINLEKSIPCTHLYSFKWAATAYITALETWLQDSLTLFMTSGHRKGSLYTLQHYFRTFWRGYNSSAWLASSMVA